MRLSTRDERIVQTVVRFRQVSASHIRRLHFADGSPASQGVRQRRSLARLTRWQQIARLPRPMGGSLGGSEGYIYVPTSSRARIADPHTLDITELYVRLVENTELVAFDPEPYCHVQVGHLEVKPDAFVDLRTKQGRYQYWIEMDRATEWRPQLNAKMRRYSQAFEKWTEPTFPLVLYIVPDIERLRFVESVVKRQYTPGHFDICLMDKAVDRLIGD